jgi:5-methylcytosine-specific restriction endonuclease McrA
MFHKAGTVKLEGDEFQRWKDAVMARDGWACRRCGRKSNLTVHHIVKRSERRLDTMENGITVCWFPCHRMLEDGAVILITEDANDFINTMFRLAGE